MDALKPPRRDALVNPYTVGGLLLCGALAGALTAAPLLAWRLGAALALDEAPSSRQAAPSAVQTPGPSAQPPPSPEAGSAIEPRLRFPVQAADRTRLRASFDDGRSGGRRHRALDIYAPRSAPVRAVDAGRVARLSRSAAGGIAIEQLDASGRFCYYYAHLARYAAGLREGQSVESGQVIGYVGTSGNAPPRTPHLHLAVFRSAPGTTFAAADRQGCWSGTALDPYPLLSEGIAAPDEALKAQDPGSPPVP